MRIDYFDDGQGAEGPGATLLLLPGSFSTPAAWKPLLRALPPGRRAVATSLCGYGTTAETRGPGDAGMEHELRVVEEVLRRAAPAGPLHLIGHSFGGTVALAAALSASLRPASLTLFEANPLELLRRGGATALYRETEAMSSDFAAAVAAGERDAAGRVIDFWGGAGAFAALPDAVQDYCRATAPANVLDWRTDFGFLAGPQCYARLDLPVLLLRGALANPAIVSITEALADALPRRRVGVVPCAGHFLISSHPGDCAALLADFLTEVE